MLSHGVHLLSIHARYLVNVLPYVRLDCQVSPWSKWSQCSKVRNYNCNYIYFMADTLAGVTVQRQKCFLLLSGISSKHPLMTKHFYPGMEVVMSISGNAVGPWLQV